MAADTDSVKVPENSSPEHPATPSAQGKSDTKGNGPTKGMAATQGASGNVSPTDDIVALGRGLDVGTANLLSAAQVGDGEPVVRAERNAFLQLPKEFTVNRQMLTNLKVPYVAYEDRLYVLGNSSFDLANLLSNEVRRPMLGGFLSPNERDAIPMIRFMLERLLGEPNEPGEACWYSLPAPSIDSDNDTVYHEGVVSSLLNKLGFTPRPINEGHAIVYSELGDSDFTGITVSCGGGMFNVCVAYRAIPAVTFSVSRGGDWIDEHVARVMGIPRTRATAIKEGSTSEGRGLNLAAPQTREEEAVVLYYRSLISYVLQNLKQRFELAQDVPQFSEPVEVVVAGGTSLVGGFTEIFAEELRSVSLPIPIKGVRRADDAFTSVVRGCLIAAALDEQG